MSTDDRDERYGLAAIVPIRSNQDTPPREERDWVTAHELCIEADVSYRQVDYWTRTGLLAPIDDPQPGSGNLRRYPADQVDRAAAVRQLLTAGIALAVIRRHVDEFVATGVLEIGPITIARTGEPA